MTAVVLRGDAAHLPLPDASVDLVCTSPPYWGLRDYRDGGGSLEGQIGSEATPGEYIANLLECTREWIRVLKPEGSIFVNLGDAYSKRADGTASRTWRGDGAEALQPSRNTTGFAPRKSLLGTPWRYAIRCTDELGLILRRDIIWHKTNGMPESVTDRCSSSHEYLFHFVKQPRYFSAVDEIREPHDFPVDHRLRHRELRGEPAGNAQNNRAGLNPLGKIPGSVWSVATSPLTPPSHLGVNHFAAWPPALVQPMILGWSPSGICTACGQGRRPVSSSVRTFDGQPRADLPAWADPSAPKRMPGGAGHRRFGTDRQHRGYACACPDTSAPTRRAVVVDAFGGTGTTAVVADALGRLGVTIDRSMDYCRLARWRTTDPGERARALGVPKPPPVPDGQGSLFDEAG